MLKNRVIPVILLKNGHIVQSKNYRDHKNLGNPIDAIKRLSEWGADELIYIDITGDTVFDELRSDLNKSSWKTLDDVYSSLAESSFMPTCIAGGVRSFDDISMRLKRGADKVGINTMLFENPDEVRQAVESFGSQSIVANLDYRELDDGERHVFYDHGNINSGMSLESAIEYVVNLGCGEILLQCIDRDGTNLGYDIDGITKAVKISPIPIIALGGAGKWKHFEQALAETKVSAVAAANIFQFKDQSVYIAKKYLFNKGLNVRKPELFEMD